MIKIGGKTFIGNDLDIVGGKIFIDGKEVTESIEVEDGILEVRVEGTIASLKCDGNVVVNGSVKGNVQAGNNVNCGDVGGSISAGNNVKCGRIGGSVSAGNNIRHA